MRECYPGKKMGRRAFFFLSSLSAMAVSMLVTMLVSMLVSTSRRRRWVVSALQGGRAGRGGAVGVSTKGQVHVEAPVWPQQGRRVTTGAADCRAAGLVSCRRGRRSSSASRRRTENRTT